MKDRPKGMTQEAKTRLPMIFSNSLKVQVLFSQARTIRPQYLSIFFVGREHMRFVESKTIPRMIILLGALSTSTDSCLCLLTCLTILNYRITI